jgi:hypothetical protein
MGTRLRGMTLGVVGLCCASAVVVAPLRAQGAAAPAGVADAEPSAPKAEAAEPAEPDHFGRVITTTTAGLALRMAQNVDFDQTALAPFYLELLGGYVFGASGPYHHGLGLGVSFNLSSDGGYTEPIAPARQWAITPNYLGYLELGPDFFGLAHIGVPILITDTKSVGVELGAGAAYRLLAGFGLYTELSFAAFMGSGSTFHPLFCWELGLSLDYEVLP